MKQSKNSSHADKIARRNVEFKINVQIIAHKLIYGFALILWIILSAWSS